MSILIGTRRALLGGAVSFVGAYDDIANLVHVYEPARRTLTSYTGNLVRLRRDSDDAESDFGYDADGNLDTAAIAAWLGVSPGYMVTVYDQKGGDNVTQATEAAQPLYVASAQNGHAGMNFNGTSHFLQGAFTNGGALSQPFAVYGVAQLDATVLNDNNNHMISDGDDGTNRMALFQRGFTTPDTWALYGGVTLSGISSDTNWNIWSVLFNGLNSQFWLNGVSGGGPGSAGTQNPDGITVGAQNGGSNLWKGFFLTLVVADPSHSDAQRSTMETAINSYWGIY